MPKFSKKRTREEAEASGSDDAGPASAPAKKVKSKDSAALGNGVDNEGNHYWELSAKRRIGISKFNKMVLVNVREYYETPAGELKPGKKGISLTVEQYQAILKNAPAINAELRKMGQDVQDPDGGGGANATVEAPKSSSRAGKEKRKKKANIEATSDEESG